MRTVFRHRDCDGSACGLECAVTETKRMSIELFAQVNQSYFTCLEVAKELTCSCHRNYHLLISISFAVREFAPAFAVISYSLLCLHQVKQTSKDGVMQNKTFVTSIRHAVFHRTILSGTIFLLRLCAVPVLTPFFDSHTNA